LQFLDLSFKIFKYLNIGAIELIKPDVVVKNLVTLPPLFSHLLFPYPKIKQQLLFNIYWGTVRWVMYLDFHFLL